MNAVPMKSVAGKSLSRLAILVVAGVAMPTLAVADPFPLKDYEQEVARYVSSLANLSVEFTDGGGADEATRERNQYSFISIPGHFRVKTTKTVTTPGKVVKTSIRWEILRPDGYFVIKEEPENRFLLVKHTSEITSPKLLPIDSGISPFMMPISRAWFPIDRTIRGEVAGFTITAKDFERIVSDGVATLQFKSIDQVHGNREETSYTLNSDWLVTRNGIDTFGSDDTKRIDTIEYVLFEGRLLPKSIITSVSSRGKPEAVGYRVDFGDYSRYDGGPEQFSLAQFGLPDERETGLRRPSRVWFWRLQAATVLGIVFVIVRFILRARRQSDSTTHQP